MSGVTLENGFEHCCGADRFAGYLHQLLRMRPELVAHYRRHYKRVKTLVGTPGWLPPEMQPGLGMPAEFGGLGSAY